MLPRLGTFKILKDLTIVPLYGFKSYSGFSGPGKKDGSQREKFCIWETINLLTVGHSSTNKYKKKIFLRGLGANSVKLGRGDNNKKNASPTPLLRCFICIYFRVNLGLTNLDIFLLLYVVIVVFSKFGSK